MKPVETVKSPWEMKHDRMRNERDAATNEAGRLRDLLGRWLRTAWHEEYQLVNDTRAALTATPAAPAPGAVLDPGMKPVPAGWPCAECGKNPKLENSAICGACLEKLLHPEPPKG